MMDLKLLSIAITGVLVVGCLGSTCNGQCVQGVQPRTYDRPNLHHRPTWNLMPMWSDSGFNDMMSLFDDPWFHEYTHTDLGSRLLYHQNLLGREERCKRQRGLQQQEERHAMAAERLQRLANLKQEEQELIDQQNQHLKAFQHQQEEFRKRQSEITKQRQEVENLDVEETRDQELQWMKERQQKMVEEERRRQQELEAAKVREQNERKQLEEQRRQAILHEKRRRAELREEQQQELWRQRQEAQKQHEDMLQRKQQQQQRTASSQHEEELRHARSNRDRPSLGKLNAKEIAKHQVTGYDPDEIHIHVIDNQVKVNGKHICHCNENCITREFARSYPLPSAVDANSVQATMDIDGNIKIYGEQNGRHHMTQSSEATIKVQGLGISQSTKPSAEELKRCLSGKGGIKLSKINKRTGRPHVNEEYKYEHEVDPVVYHGDMDANDDDGYIEVEN